jgi:hypothetical protein
MPPAVRLFYHTLLLSLMVGWAFVWLKTPSLSPYSLQLFGSSVIAYFVIKKLNKAEFWQLLPSPVSLEMAAATLAFLLVIGATGNLQSPLFALTFVHLFFLALSTHTVTAIVLTFAIVLFHYGMAKDITALEISSLTSIVVVMGFFMLVKDQFLKVFKQQVALNASLQKISELQAADHGLEQLLSQVLGFRKRTPQPTVAVTEPEVMPEVDLPEIDELLTEALKPSHKNPARTSELLADDIIKSLG